jgi:hypothetical protein
MPKFRSIFISFVTLCAILGVAIAVIAYGRGYRLDLNKTSLKPTGIISATSDPVGAQVLVDGVLKTATNNSFNIDPGFYTVRITKESYIPWEKKIRVQGEVVSAISAFLFPTNPSLSPITTLGIVNPTLSPDGTRVAYIIPADHLDSAVVKKAGLWYYELSEGPLGRNRDPVQVDSTGTIDFAATRITWSPDATQLLVEASSSSRLYTLGKPNTFADVTATSSQLVADWRTAQADTDKQKLAAFKPAIVNMATSSAKIISFSPDETKILYQATASATIPQVIIPPLIGTNSTPEDRNIVPGKFYVYDSKEDKNYFLLNKNEISGAIQWFPTSRHLLLTLKGKIDVMEYDRTNWVTIYSGPFVDDFVAPWSNGSRIIILTNLNGDALSIPNLYTVNLR